MLPHADVQFSIVGVLLTSSDETCDIISYSEGDCCNALPLLLSLIRVNAIYNVGAQIHELLQVYTGTNKHEKESAEAAAHEVALIYKQQAISTSSRTGGHAETEGGWAGRSGRDLWPEGGSR